MEEIKFIFLGFILGISVFAFLADPIPVTSNKPITPKIHIKIEDGKSDTTFYYYNQ